MMTNLKRKKQKRQPLLRMIVVTMNLLTLMFVVAEFAAAKELSPP
jgi:hypothetical protein